MESFKVLRDSIVQRRVAQYKGEIQNKERQHLPFQDVTGHHKLICESVSYFLVMIINASKSRAESQIWRAPSFSK